MKPTAIILSGAVIKGAWECGVLKVLTQQDLNIKSIVGSSSGSLNALGLAAGIVSGRVDFAIDDLISVWRDKAGWRNGFLNLSLKNIVGLRGLSSSKNLRNILQGNVERILTAKTNNRLDLSFAITQLGGNMAFINGQVNTTYENTINFTQDDFYSESGKNLMLDAACASSAFPAMFAPVNVAGYGWCVDGGVVNNAAILTAIRNPTIERIIVISPSPYLHTNKEDYSGLDLFSKVAEIVVNERLYRDLGDAFHINSIMKKLNDLVANKIITPEQMNKIDTILGHKRQIEIVQVRPKQKLAGNSFSGIFSRKLREEYIEAGMKAAQEIKL